MSQSDSELVTLEDLHASATIADESQSSEDCGVAVGAVGDFLSDTQHVWAGQSTPSGILWGIAIGIMAERHRIHRTEHVGADR